MRARSPGPSNSSFPTPSPGAWPWRPARPCGGVSSPPLSRSDSRPCTPGWRRSAAGATVRKWLWWGLQLAVAGVVARLVWDAIVKNWSEFRSLHVSLAPRPGWIALSALVVFVKYAIQVETWRRGLAGGGPPLPYRPAAPPLALVHLGRLTPRQVWRAAGAAGPAPPAG